MCWLEDAKEVIFVVLSKLNAQSYKCLASVTWILDNFATLVYQIPSLVLKKIPSEGEDQNKMLNSSRWKSPWELLEMAYNLPTYATNPSPLPVPPLASLSTCLFFWILMAVFCYCSFISHLCYKVKFSMNSPDRFFERDKIHFHKLRTLNIICCLNAFL